jgi:hypothetical protein
VPGEDADALALERVPDVARPVVVATKQDATRDGERDGGDTAQDVVVRVRVQLAVRADIEQPARCIVGASRKRVAVREKPAPLSVPVPAAMTVGNSRTGQR